MRAKVGPIVQVYVVAKQKNYGEPLVKDDVKLAYWPQNSLPEGAFQKEEALFPAGANMERFVLRNLEPNEPVMAIKITEPGQPPGLTGQIGKGMRAFAIKVDVTSGVSGFVQPGDHVDIYWTGSVNGMEGNITRLIESTTRVIAVDQQAGATSGATVARTVTVAATPDQVARLALAQETGNLALSLVGDAAETIDGKIEVNARGLLGIQDQEIVAKKEEKVCTIRNRKGGEVTEIPIPCTN